MYVPTSWGGNSCLGLKFCGEQTLLTWVLIAVCTGSMGVCGHHGAERCFFSLPDEMLSGVYMKVQRLFRATETILFVYSTWGYEYLWRHVVMVMTQLEENTMWTLVCGDKLTCPRVVKLRQKHHIHFFTCLFLQFILIIIIIIIIFIKMLLFYNLYIILWEFLFTNLKNTILKLEFWKTKVCLIRNTRQNKLNLMLKK